MEIKYHAQFLLDKEKGKTDAKLRYRIKWNGNIVAFNLGYRIDIEKWSTETQRCKANTTHGKNKISASVINKKIQQFETACEMVISQFELINNLLPSVEDFKIQFNKQIGREIKEEKKEKDFFHVFDEFTRQESKINQWTISTEKKMQTVKSHLKGFDEGLNFDDLNEKKLLEYQLYLQNTLKFKNSTVLKQYSFLKWFLRWSKKKGYIKVNDFEFFKPKLKTVQKKVIFLTHSELLKLQNYKIPKQKQYLERVRDVFLFQCYTGLRYSDVANLTKGDFKENYFEVTTVKTSDSLIIELNKYSKTIWEKYKDYSFANNKAFPVITNQKMNDYLKELAELAEINEPVRETYYRGNQRYDEITPKYSLLGTHAGRRTFICNALSLGIPPQVVMKWTGHSDYKAMKPYIDIADDIKANAMEKFNLL